MKLDEYRKTWVSVILGLLVIIDQIWGIRIGWLTEEYITIVIAALWPLLVLVTPNAS